MVESFKKVYFLVLVSLGVIHKSAGGSSCPVIFEEARVPCGSTGVREVSCLDQDCCWDPDASTPALRCYRSACKPGHFGWGCRFRCKCKNNGPCNSDTGECTPGCHGDRWGSGCLLLSNCTYNDPYGEHYLGKLTTTENRHTCQPWLRQRSYPGTQFPDGNQRDAGNYCRNPKPSDYRLWCYHKMGKDRRWDYCTIQKCRCETGRYGTNCHKECHCKDEAEQCNQSDGHCSTGCHPRWTGSGCQECANGYFGTHCEKVCHCHSHNDVCDKNTGFCSSGCADGWMGQDCQSECVDGRFGYSCRNLCKCRNPSEVCNKKNGTCRSGCKEGHTGAGCQIECHCKDPNELCGYENGGCLSGCAENRTGSACHIEIPKLTRAPELVSRYSTSITIKWRKWSRKTDIGQGPVDSYIVEYKQQGETDWKQQSVSANSPLRLIHMGLLSDKTYVFRVRPVHRKGFQGSASPQMVVSTCGKPISGPRDLKLKFSNTNRENGSDSDSTPQYVQLTATWRVPSPLNWNCDRIVHYRVYLKEPGSSQWKYKERVEFSKSGPTSYIVGQVNAFQNMSVGVSAVNNAGMESDMTKYNLIGKSGPVRNMLGDSLSPTSLMIKWKKPLATNGLIIRYMLKFKEIQVTDCVIKNAQWMAPIPVDSTATSYEIGGLVPYSKYQVRVWAETAAGKGQPETKTVITYATRPTGQVIDLELTSVKNTSVIVRWKAPDCEERNGAYSHYLYELNKADRSDRLIGNGSVKNTTLTVTSLVPYTRYSFFVWYVNHLGRGPISSALEFTTKQGKPPAPRNVQCQIKESHALTVVWHQPKPPHGVIKEYDIKYWSADALAHLASVAGDTVQYRLSALQPNTSYGIRIRAQTEAAVNNVGPWSSALFCYTDEHVPEVPRNFRNVSRTETSLTFSWVDPARHNGVLKSYAISCKPDSVLGQYFSAEVSHEIRAPQRKYKLIGLLPGTEYICSIRASTSKGYGHSTAGKFWTYPPKPSVPVQPVVDSKMSTDTSIAVKLAKTMTVPQTGGAQSVYQVIVEKIVKEKRRKKRSAVPCNNSSRLLDYITARAVGSPCYVAAVLGEDHLSDKDVFIVGDNKTYGGYYNAPLESGETYDIWLGVAVSVDGVTSVSYSKTDTSTMVRQYVAPGEGRNRIMMMAGAGAAGLAILIVLVIFLLFLVLRRKKPRKKAASTHGSHCSQDSLKHGDTDKGLVLPDVCSSSAEDLNQELAEREPLYKRQVSVEVMDRAISVDNLWNYIKEKKMNRHEGFRKEYDELPHGLTEVCEVARKPQNKYKNRYANIVAYDQSRMKLDLLADDAHSDYINANYVDAYRKPNAYIATQGPSKFTLNDIWRMAWQVNSSRIVMVTNLVEDGRHKCEQYWPDRGSKQYGNVQVTAEDFEQLADYTMRTFTMTVGGLSKTVRQFHFTAWPDHGVPTYATSLLGFRKKVRSFDDPMSGPTIVHCSAGVGRTGTFIAVDHLLDQAKVEGQVDIYTCVLSMRRKRVNMVQTQEQYIFVYDALLEALMCGDTSVSCCDFREHYADLCKVNPETGKIRLLEEFELLNSMSPTLDSEGCQDALDPENIDKNRFKDIVPDNMMRPYLVTYIQGATDYINAVYVDGYKQKDGFIITQMPLPNTLTDFWSMVYDHKVRTIIMLNELDLTDQSCAQYWPDDVGYQHYGPFTVELVSVDITHPEVTIREFSTSGPGSVKKNSKVVCQFQFHSRHKDISSPLYKTAMLSLFGLVEKWQQRSGNGTIAVHCMNGASHSGLYCAVTYMLERMKVEQEIDIFQTVKHIRMNRPQLIENLEQYRFCYEMAVEYMDCFETYANFK